MAITLVNRAKMSTSTTGTGTITLGSALTGFQTFDGAGVTNGQTVRYVIEDGDNFEIGSGAYTTSGTTLARGATESSNSDNAISLSGSATVFIAAVAADIFTNDGSRSLTTTGVITGGTVEATADTSAGDNAAMGHTSAEGLILTGQGSTNDVTIKNDADADVLEIPTGTTNVTVAGNLGVGGTVTATGTSVFATLDISGDVDVDGTLESDAITLNGTAVTATATLNTGISNNNVPKFTSGVADNDFLRVDGTAIEGRSAAEVLSDIGAAPAAGSSNVVTTGALNSGSITSGFGTIDTGSSAITTTGVITGGTVEATADTAAGDNAAIGYTAAEGLILTGQGSTNDVTIKNDADADVLEIPTGTTDVGIVGSVSLGTSDFPGKLTVRGQTIIGGLVAASANLANYISGTPPQLVAGWSLPDISYTFSTSTEAVFSRDGDMNVCILSGVDSKGQLNFADPADEDAGAISYDHSDNGMTFRTNGTNQMTLNASGTLTATALAGSGAAVTGTAKAFVNFNGTGTIAIRASSNVASLTDNGTGTYTVNLTNNMSDANYTSLGSAADDSDSPTRTMMTNAGLGNSAGFVKIRVETASGSAVDGNYCGVALHGTLA